MKYILVTGCSGIGKTIILSSIGRILKVQGIEVTAIKLDNYYNIDARNLPGEVFILEDGTMAGSDLGVYEDIMDFNLLNYNHMTMGKIHTDVMRHERNGDFLGRKVQESQIVEYIVSWLEHTAKKPVSNSTSNIPEICLIEESQIVEYIVSWSHTAKKPVSNSTSNIPEICLIELGATLEHKLKPTQASVNQMRDLGLRPDLPLMLYYETTENRQLL